MASLKEYQDKTKGPFDGKLPIEIHMTWNEETAMWPGQLPTPLQRLWGKVFLSLWYLVDSVGAGGGKTWFWRHVIDFIESQDPQVTDSDIQDRVHPR